MCVRDCRTIDHILDTEHPEETLLLMFIFWKALTEAHLVYDEKWIEQSPYKPTSQTNIIPQERHAKIYRE